MLTIATADFDLFACWQYIRVNLDRYLKGKYGERGGEKGKCGKCGKNGEEIRKN